MKKLALIGKEIHHSLSPSLYKNLLHVEHEYHLLNYENESEIPPLTELMIEYDGINITAPYKKTFLNKIEIIGGYSCLNTIRNYKGKIQGTSTDSPAMEEFLSKKLYPNQFEKIILLGGGAMADLLISIFKKHRWKFDQLTRNNAGPLEHLSFLENPLLIINSCSRSFTYKGEIHSNNIFWDLNYNHTKHKKLLGPQCKYWDGMELLQRQAELAMNFWNF